MGDILIRGVEMPKSKPILLFLLPDGTVFCDGVCLAQNFEFFSEQDERLQNLLSVQSEPDPEWRKKHYEASYAQGFVDGCKLYEQKTGKWYIDAEGDVRCTACKTKCLRDDIGINILSNYCPSCGVDMR